jgi:hypothetical protein
MDGKKGDQGTDPCGSPEQGGERGAKKEDAADARGPHADRPSRPNALDHDDRWQLQQLHKERHRSQQAYGGVACTKLDRESNEKDTRRQGSHRLAGERIVKNQPKRAGRGLCLNGVGFSRNNRRPRRINRTATTVPIGRASRRHQQSFISHLASQAGEPESQPALDNIAWARRHTIEPNQRRPLSSALADEIPLGSPGSMSTCSGSCPWTAQTPLCECVPSQLHAGTERSFRF